MSAWQDTVAPITNVLRAVIVPRLVHTTRNRLLLASVLGLDAQIGLGEIYMIALRLPNPPPELESITAHLDVIATIVDNCAVIRSILEDTQRLGLQDIDNWPDY